MKKQAVHLRNLTKQRGGVFAFGVTTPMDARVAEMAGVEAIYAGGYAAAGRVNRPDMGFITRTDMVRHAREIAGATNLPVVIDMDDGYGSALIARDTIHELLETVPRIAGFHLEDQKFPKRCGHIAGKEVVPIDDYVGKLRAVIDVRNELNPSVLIIARTDAFSAAGGEKDPLLGGDIKEAVKRGIAYADAGADIVWCEFPSPDIATARAFAEGVHEKHPKLPFAINISPSFSEAMWEEHHSVFSREKLADLGYVFRFATYPALLASMDAVYKAARAFQENEIWAMLELKRRVGATPTESAMKVVGVDKYLELERRYVPDAERNQETSEGFTGAEEGQTQLAEKGEYQD